MVPYLPNLISFGRSAGHAPWPDSMPRAVGHVAVHGPHLFCLKQTENRVGESLELAEVIWRARHRQSKKIHAAINHVKSETPVCERPRRCTMRSEDHKWARAYASQCMQSIPYQRDIQKRRKCVHMIIDNYHTLCNRIWQVLKLAK